MNTESSAAFTAMGSTGATVFCGDTSGSMSGEGIKLLKRAYTNILKEAGTKRLSFMSWQSTTEWWNRAAGKWISPSDITQVEHWIKALTAGGGNDMQSPLKRVIAELPDVEEIIVACDGDINPFYVKGVSAASQGEVDWKNFCREFPRIKFHFVALGAGSDFAAMQQMAIIGGGSFSATNI